MSGIKSRKLSYKSIAFCSLKVTITLFLKQAVNTSSIPFEIKAPQFSDEMMESIKEADEMKKHPEKYKTYTSVEELVEDLHNEI